MNSSSVGYVPKDENSRTSASKRYNKDCYDFTCLNDGTKAGESKYCQFSSECQQLDVSMNGTVVPMEAHIHPVVSTRTGEVIEHKMLCTGNHDLRPKNDRLYDREAS